MVEFKLFGIPIRVEPIFWLTLGIIGLLSTNANSAEGLLLMALFMLAGFASILIHEMGHALMIKHYKLPTQVVLSNFGGYASYPAGILDRKQSFLVTAAGPGLQILAATAVYFLFPHMTLGDSKLIYFFIIFIQISYFWALLNCLPILPLDGGQMLGAIMGPKRKAALHLVSIITAAVVAIYAISAGYIFGAIFMGMFAYQNYQAWKQTKS